MSGKDTGRTFHEKLKQFFRLNKSGSGTLRCRADISLTQEIVKEISQDTPMSHRTKALKDLSEEVVAHHFDDRAITTLWLCTADMVSENQSRETRHITFHFLNCLCRGQSDRLNLLRAQVFRLIKNVAQPDDTVPRFDLLHTLTENGKDISYFEEEIGCFLLQWMPDVTAAGKTLEFLSLLVNVIKFNAAYIDEDVISGFVSNTCLLCCSSGNQQPVVLECLKVLDTIVCYSILPNDSLPTFIAALCRTVNHEAYCQSSWKTMRNLLGTHLGHASLYTMCRALQEPLRADVGLLRGAVFHVNMGLWGRHRVTTLVCSPAAVLPSFLQALKCNHPLVMYEVMLSIQMLIKKSGCKLQDPTWDNILDVIEAIIEHIASTTPSNPQRQVAIHLHETLCTVEQLHELGTYNGSVKRIFELIERCAPVRPESSVLRLVSYLATSIVPTRHLWQTKLNQLMERYFKQETRTNVRVKVIDILSQVIKVNRTYEDELMESIVVVHLQNIAADNDVKVRNTVAYLLVNLIKECESKRCLELLDILDKLLKRPFEVGDSRDPGADCELLDVETVVNGLVNVFVVKIYQLPSVHAIRIYKMLVNHLEMHYARPHVFDGVNSVRLKIFETFLKIRANASYHIGYPDTSSVSAVLVNSSGVRFSPYVSVGCAGSNSPPPGSPAAILTQQQHTITQVSLRKGFKCFVTCLKQEKDWEVLHLILQEVPKVMENKTLILSRHGNNEIDLLATALCDMINDKSLGLPETLRNTSSKLSKSDFHSHVLPVLASLASYHAYLDSALQKRIVRSLVKFGLVSRCSRQCITALTTCTLEMREVMVKMLPEVLLDISKFSATVLIAIPVLEFLSTLTRIPDVFSSFVGDQYMSVFAISLPFTNPFKYNHYTVSLAHHVIAVWFLKCRLPFRRDFVKFITKGLKTNVIVPFEEGQQLFKPDLVLLNEDSSNRKRSSSLTEQGSRGRRERGAAPPAARLDTRAALDLRPPMDEALNTFHTELTETCIDLMARYTFSLCSALPKRLPTADFLLSGGQSMTWLLGNMLITVTTSGCAQKALKHGLCDKCWSVCKADSITTPDTERYGKSTFNRSTSGEDSQSNRPTRQSSTEVQKSSQDSPVDEKKEGLVHSTSTIAENLEQQLPNKLHQLLGTTDPQQAKLAEKTMCVCWCQGWAEICIRRPTGDMSWVMRIQNQIQNQTLSADFPINELSTLYMPSLDRQKDEHTHTRKSNLEMESLPDSLYENTSVKSKLSLKTNSISGPINIPGSPMRQSPSRQNSHESVDDDDNGDIYDDHVKSRNPVRRSNSSPEMTASWKNPFMTQEKIDKMIVFGPGEMDATVDVSQKKIKTNYGKDMRVSCEAIPEEMGLGTTPPASETVEPSVHTHLHSFHSYPGTTPPNSSVEIAKTSSTVPTSPITLGAAQNAIASVPPQPLFKTALINQSTTKSAAPAVDSIVLSEVQKSYGRPKNLPVLNQPLTTKPPQSPTQTTPRFLRHPTTLDKELVAKPNTSTLFRSNTLDKQTKFGYSSENINDPCVDLSAVPIRRDRGHTISVMSQDRKPRIRRTNSPRTKELPKSGINPSFVFLQLYHSATFGSNEKPLLIGQSQTVQRSLQLLDTIPPYEIHKVGVIYVGRGQNNNQVAILRNTYGSLRYVQFLQKLGTMVKLQDVDPQIYFLGGLDQHGKDGKFAYIWHDDVMQMAFHVATLMPNADSDPSSNEKTKHIGNDFVTIVYNESGEEYNMKTIKGSFNFSCIVIEPLDHNTNRVSVKAIEELADHIGHSEPKIISDQNLAILTRQLALHANLASMISNSLKSCNRQPYASHWLERLRHIKRLRSKVLQDIEDSSEKGPNGITVSADTDGLNKRSTFRIHMDDFTEYT